MFLQRNELLEWQVSKGQTRIERVLWTNEVGTGVWTIDIIDEKAWPIYQQYDDLETSLATGEVRRLEKLNSYLAKLLPEDEYLKKHSKRAKINYALIAPLVENGNSRIYARCYRGRMVAELSNRLGVRKAQIYLLLRRFWQGGCIPYATLPKYFRCGQTKDRQGHGKKVGRPNNGGRNLTAEDKEKFSLGINEFKKTGRANKLPKVWQLTIAKYYNLGYDERSDGTLVPILPPADTAPSLGQFKYEYYKNRDPKVEIIAIEGEKEFERNNRPTLGDETLTAFGPGAVYQIDASIGDIYLRCYLKRKLIIGRPIIYIIVDVFSRMIVGFAVTLEGPSWAGARLALENAFSDKVTFCKRFGIEITEERWPVKGKCEALVADNGEIAGYNANSLVDPLGIRVANAPTHRPDLKGIVESRFPIIKGLVIEWVPGAVRPTCKRRGIDYRLDATLDLNQFRRLMIKGIIRYNNSQRIESYRMSCPMIADEIEPIPIKIWEWGMQKLTGRLRLEDDMEALRIKLLPRDTATVTSKGIRFRGIHYTCERALQEQWFLRLKGKRSKHMEIVYESIVDRVYLRLRKGLYEPCALTSADERFQGWDWYEVLEYFALKKQAAKAAETDQLQAAAEFHAEAERIISEAKEMNKLAAVDDARSKTARVRGIRENRKALKIHERKHRLGNSATKESSGKPAKVVPLKHPEKPTTDKGYVPPARPYSELRKARKEIRKDGR
ncbi:MAG TPA: hypothetical protein VHU19_01840 [Pyrinomonadaceae bacterium]|jgi:hypothetical protein|nr:hypothetical protein [Pyrinomonadaceae bacterium]